MRRAVLVGGAVLVLLAGGAGVALAVGRHSTAPHHAATLATVTVAQGTLSEAQALTGALGYGAPTAVNGRAPADGTGTVTWLPSSEATIARGQQVYRVDDRPVSLLYGDLPLYRTLTSHPQAPTTPTTPTTPPPADGTPTAPPPAVPLLKGHDVDLLAANLAALGFYDGATTGVSYGWSMAYAVEQWQKSLGEQPTGIVDPADVVVAPGRVRVDGVTAHLGDAVAEPILTLTTTAKVVTLQASPDLVSSIKPGRAIQVKLADGRLIATHVVSIGTATPSSDGTPPSVPIVVRPAKPLGKAPLGPVTATVVTASVADAVHVPVAALLALAGGGYALERTDHTLVPVSLGMVADGEVQVSGVEPGTKVVVAR